MQFKEVSTLINLNKHEIRMQFKEVYTLINLINMKFVPLTFVSAEECIIFSYDMQESKVHTTLTDNFLYVRSLVDTVVN